MPSKILTIEQVLNLLEATPLRISELTRGLGSSRLSSPRMRGEWSANDVLAHLRACADVWGGCMVAIIEGAATLRAVNPRTWIDQTDYLEQDFNRSLRSFSTQRKALLEVLKPLARSRWFRAVSVTGAGAVLNRDVLFYGRWMARHESAHIKQIARIVGR